jgi:hypothetical protein
VEASLRNFLAEVVQQLPLPAILRFDTDRRLRVSLQRQCKQLQKENAELRGVCWHAQVLCAAGCALSSRQFHWQA